MIKHIQPNEIYITSTNLLIYLISNWQFEHLYPIKVSVDKYNSIILIFLIDNDNHSLYIIDYVHNFILLLERRHLY